MQDGSGKSIERVEMEKKKSVQLATGVSSVEFNKLGKVLNSWIEGGLINENPAESAERSCNPHFNGIKATADEAAVTAESLIRAEMRGLDTHVLCVLKITGKPG